MSVIRYVAGIIEWTKLELQDIDRKTRKLLTIYRGMHPQADVHVDRLYWKRAERGKGLQSVEETVHLEDISLGFYLKDKEEILLKEVIKEGIIKESNIN